MSKMTSPQGYPRAQRELDIAREALANVEHGADPEPTLARYAAALEARNALRGRGDFTLKPSEVAEWVTTITLDYG